MKKLMILGSMALLLMAGQYDVTGIRKTSLTAGSENLPKIEYTNQQAIPGEVSNYKTSFSYAPPMIPHSIKGMTPIKIGNNECIVCHMPRPAKAMGITSIPADHLVDNFDGDKKSHRLAGSRFNCTQCHAPQAELDPAIENRFETMENQRLLNK